jgi:NAD(P)-dependent dehydrogenase (short-subunit alcohol dehydrogenase family)
MPADRPVAVISGANRGIGLEVARQLAAAGFLTDAARRRAF